VFVVVIVIFKTVGFAIKLAPEPKTGDSAAKDPGVDPSKSDLEDLNSSVSHSENSTSPCQSPNSGKQFLKNFNYSN
jgi:hypothetical protein